MSKKRAFVRYTKSGEIVPGSLIITTNGGYPDKSSLWQEVTVDQCCGSCALPPVILSFNISEVNFEEDTIYSNLLCNGNSTMLTTSVTPSGPITPQQYVNELNSSLGWTGAFTLNGEVINYELNGCLAQLMCPNGELTFIIDNPTGPVGLQLNDIMLNKKIS